MAFHMAIIMFVKVCPSHLHSAASPTVSHRLPPPSPTHLLHLGYTMTIQEFAS